MPNLSEPSDAWSNHQEWSLHAPCQGCEVEGMPRGRRGGPPGLTLANLIRSSGMTRATNSSRPRMSRSVIIEKNSTEPPANLASHLQLSTSSEMRTRTNLRTRNVPDDDTNLTSNSGPQVLLSQSDRTKAQPRSSRSGTRLAGGATIAPPNSHEGDLAHTRYYVAQQRVVRAAVDQAQDAWRQLDGLATGTAVAEDIPLQIAETFGDRRQRSAADSLSGPRVAPLPPGTTR